MQFVSKQSKRVYRALNPNGDPFSYNSKRDPILEIVGLVLWATEGDKTQLSLANGNPSIITKYLEFLRVICRIQEQKLKAVIHHHNSIPYRECLDYWTRITNIPEQRFTKPYIKKDRGGTRHYPYGIVRIVATNIKLIHIFKERLKDLGLSKD